MELVHARARRRMSRGLKRKPMALIKRLRKAKKSESIPPRFFLVCFLRCDVFSIRRSSHLVVLGLPPDSFLFLSCVSRPFVLSRKSRPRELVVFGGTLKRVGVSKRI